MRFTDTEGYFVSEASVYRLLKAHDLIASPAFIVMKAAEEFTDKTTAPNQLCRPTSLISRSSAGAGSTCRPFGDVGFDLLSQIARQVVVLQQDAVLQRLVPTLDFTLGHRVVWSPADVGHRVARVTATLELALDASGLDKASVLHRPRLLSDNGSSYISDDLAKWMT